MGERKSNVRERVTPEGRWMGALLAKLADDAATSAWNIPERCASCAFRLGTLPNGAADTVWDALKCVAEKWEFGCHHDLDEDGRPTKTCAGYLLATSAAAPKLPQAVIDYVTSQPYSETLIAQEKARVVAASPGAGTE